MVTFHRKSNNLAPAELKKIHPLGKSPVVSITPVGGGPDVVLAESGFIVQYLCEHFGSDTTMMPRRYQEGKEGQAGGETEAWLRWQYLLHFTEGTMLPSLIMGWVISGLQGSQVPFFIRPITSLVAGKIIDGFVHPNIRAQLEFLEQQLATSGGDYLCGEHLTAADVLLSFGLITGREKVATLGNWGGRSPRELFPKLFAYIDRLETHPGYKRSVQKVKEIDESLGIRFQL